MAQTTSRGRSRTNATTTSTPNLRARSTTSLDCHITYPPALQSQLRKHLYGPTEDAFQDIVDCFFQVAHKPDRKNKSFIVDADNFKYIFNAVVASMPADKVVFDGDFSISTRNSVLAPQGQHVLSQTHSNVILLWRGKVVVIFDEIYHLLQVLHALYPDPRVLVQKIFDEYHGIPAWLAIQYAKACPKCKDVLQGFKTPSITSISSEDTSLGHNDPPTPDADAAMRPSTSSGVFHRTQSYFDPQPEASSSLHPTTPARHARIQAHGAIPQPFINESPVQVPSQVGPDRQPYRMVRNARKPAKPNASSRQVPMDRSAFTEDGDQGRRAGFQRRTARLSPGGTSQTVANVHHRREPAEHEVSRRDPR